MTLFLFNDAGFSHSIYNFEKDRPTNDVKINGFFEILNSEFVALYQDAGQLFVSLRKRRFDFHLAKLVIRKNGMLGRVLEIADGDDRELLDYELKAIDVIPDDPTPMAEEEHFDFGLFLSELSRDQSRQDRLVDIWSR